MFWIISAIFIMIALAFIFPALRSKDAIPDVADQQNIVIAREQLNELEMRFEQGEVDADAYQSARDELEQSLFDDLKGGEPIFESVSNKPSISHWFILLLIPVITIPVYLKVGNLNFTKELDSKQAAIKATGSSIPLNAEGQPDMDVMIARLKEEMEKNPTDPQGWYMLGRANMSEKRFEDAADAFEKSLALRPDLANTMLSLADALSMANKGQLKGKPRALVKKALAIEPRNVTALWLSGMAASQEAEYIEAINRWEEILPLLSERPKEKVAVNDLIAEAKSRLSAEQKQQLELDKKNTLKTSTASVTESNAKKTSATENKGVNVSITLSKALMDKVSPEDSIFIYAKAMQGPPMPLAAVRKQVKDLPIKLVLNDEMAMMPSLKLSSFEQFTVGARVSKSGQAIPQNGDFYAEKTEIKAGNNVNLEIDQILNK